MGENHFGDLRIPNGQGPHPIAVVVHGGFWRAHQDLGYLGHLCEVLLEYGIATWNIEFRRVGQVGGGWPGTLQDVGQATDYLRVLAAQFDLDLARTIAVGHSAGGHLALWLAARSRIPRASPLWAPNPLPLRAAISVNGVVDLRKAWELDLGSEAVARFLGGAPNEVPDRYASASPAELIPFGTTQVLVHGGLDDEVPPSIGEDYVAAALARGDKALLIRMPSAGHFEPIDPQFAEGRQTLAIIANALRGRPPDATAS